MMFSACAMLTGPMGSGKTTTLRSLVECLGAEGRRVRAVVQTADARRPDGGALGFSMTYLSSSDGIVERRSERLARELSPGEITPDGMMGFGRFCFDTAVFLRAQEFMCAGMEGPHHAQIVGIDEIGRLELFRKGGLRSTLDRALKEAGRPGGPLLLLSVREECVPDLRRLAAGAGVDTMLVERPDANAAMRVVRGMLDGLLSQERGL